MREGDDNRKQSGKTPLYGPGQYKGGGTNSAKESGVQQAGTKMAGHGVHKTGVTGGAVPRTNPED